MKYFIMSLLLVSLFSNAKSIKSNPCIKPTASADTVMIDKMVSDMNIDFRSLNRSRTRSSLIDNSRVSSSLIQQFAKETFSESTDKLVSLNELEEIFGSDNVRNLIIEFTYEDKTGKKNVFLVSQLVNDYECGVRFNGYLTVSREF